MRKVLTIIQREYWTRVRTKAFILGTLLMPLGMGLLLVITVLAATSVEKESVQVWVQDNSREIFYHLKSDEQFTFTTTGESRDVMKSKLQEGEVYMSLDSSLLKKEGSPRVELLVGKKLSIQIKDGVRRRLEEAVKESRMRRLGISMEDLQSIKVNIELSEENTLGEKSHAEAGMVAGYIMSMLIYILMVMYGMHVMRGVIEEKTSRIVEVIISSVKPMQLMLGKLIGICLVGLTQFILWIILSFIITAALSAFIAPDPAQLQQITLNNGMVNGMPQEIPAESMEIATSVLSIFNVTNMLLFLFYFLGGFFLYGSLFAAVGSAVDQEADAQQLMWPVMIPLVIPIMLITNVLQSPNGTLATILSLFPFSSPTIMMVRITSTDVPAWQVLLSMALLIAGFLGTVWLAGRIYRTGVLMYGKKVSIREIGKWIFRF